jgi:3',5'-cyclic AMP phosphodiesterase CpdA
MSDPQLGMGGYEHDTVMLAKAVDQINAMEIDFVVVCGDLVHHFSDSAYEDYLGIIGRMNVPVYAVPGNHDVGREISEKKLAYYREHIGKDYYSMEHKGFGFVFVNTQYWIDTLYHESEQHARWFEDELIAMNKKKLPVFVVGHYPVFIRESGEKDEYFNIPLTNRKTILEQMKNSNVLAYLSGHKHEMIENDYDGIMMVTGETTSKNFDKRPMGFRKWEVTKEGISHAFVSVE